MTDPVKLTELLSTYGIAAVAAISVLGNVALLIYIKAQHKERLQEQREDNEALLAMAEERIESDLKHARAFKDLTSVVSKLIEKL